MQHGDPGATGRIGMLPNIFHKMKAANSACSAHLVMSHFGKLEMSHFSKPCFDFVRRISGTICDERARAWTIKDYRGC